MQPRVNGKETIVGIKFIKMLMLILLSFYLFVFLFFEKLQIKNTLKDWSRKYTAFWDF